MRNYLLKIDSTHDATVYIKIDSDEKKPVRVFYRGNDPRGVPFEQFRRGYCKIGNAARYLERVAAMWGPETVKTHGTPADIEYTGADAETAKDFYCRLLPWYV